MRRRRVLHLSLVWWLCKALRWGWTMHLYWALYRCRVLHPYRVRQLCRVLCRGLGLCWAVWILNLALDLALGLS